MPLVTANGAAGSRVCCNAVLGGVSLISLIIADITTILETIENLFNQWMVYRHSMFVRLQIPFGYISRVKGVVNKHMIPRLVFGRTRFRDFSVPLFGPLENGVDVEDYAPIIKKPVMN